MSLKDVITDRLTLSSVRFSALNKTYQIQLIGFPVSVTTYQSNRTCDKRDNLLH